MNNVKDGIKKLANETKKVIENVKTNASISVSNFINSSIDSDFEIKKAILDKIKQYNTIIIVRHIRPDGDCIGSSLGLRNILRLSFPNKKIYSVGDDKASYLSFMGNEDILSDNDSSVIDIYKNALIIALDTADRTRISNKLYTNAKEIIKIDHHVETDPYGTINYVKDDVSATAQLIANFYETFSNELKMDIIGATALYTGLITDTGRFRYKEVDSSTLEVAANLLKFNVNTQDIYANLYVDSKESLKLKGLVINKFKTTKNGVSYMFLTKRMQKKYKVTLEEASNQVNCLDGIKGSLIWILFVQTDESIRVRLRSRYIDIIDIAKKFNGGGHVNACGATVYSKNEIKQLVKKADEKLKQFKDENKDTFK